MITQTKLNYIAKYINHANFLVIDEQHKKTEFLLTPATYAEIVNKQLDGFIILKPFKDISDEHAIELANINCDESSDIWTIYERTNNFILLTNIRGDKFWIWFDPSIGFISYENNDKYFNQETVYPIQSIEFLISKGYAISTENLFDIGIAIDEKTVKNK